MPRALDDTWFHRIKSATRDLVTFCGGVERAGGKADLSTSQISRCQSSADPTILTLTAALALERDCGQPLITAVMAEMQGRQLTGGGGEGAGAAPGLVETHSRLLNDVARLVSDFATAAADGHFTPGEVDVIERAKTQVLHSLTALGQACASAKAGAGSGPRLVS